MKHIAPLVAAFFLICTAGQSFADEALVFPRGARVGLVPILGLSPAKTFTGFETEGRDVKVIVSELPPTAYAEVDKAFKGGTGTGKQPESIETGAGRAFYTADGAQDEAGKPVRRYSMILQGGTFSGYVAVQVAENAIRIFSDDAIRQLFASAKIRSEVPVPEQLSLLPFDVTQTSDFKNVRTLVLGAALLLADGSDETRIESAPYMVLGTIGSAPERSDDRGRFAQQAAGLIPGLRDIRVTMSEPLRIDGAPGYETRLDAISGIDNTPVNVVQWLRFGSGSTAVRVIGSTPRDAWATSFPRFRAVRDGINPR